MGSCFSKDAAAAASVADTNDEQSPDKARRNRQIEECAIASEEIKDDAKDALDAGACDGSTDCAVLKRMLAGALSEADLVHLECR